MSDNMGKDPAVLFYTSDFLTGTFTFTDEQTGKYIRLLCLQHQKGKLTEKDMLSICKAYDEDIYSKFTKKDKYYFNKRMFEEAERRRKFTESRRTNAKGKKKEKAYAQHMETETETENKIVIKKEGIFILNNIELIKKDYFFDMLPTDCKFIESWVEWVDYRKEIKKKLTKTTAKKQLNFLYKQANIREVINQTIQNGWIGLFELTKGNNGTNRKIYKSEINIAGGDDAESRMQTV